MKRLDEFIAWFSGHRTQFGGFCTSIGATMLFVTQYYPAKLLTAAGATLAFIGTNLMTTGMFKSDDFHRDKLKVIETKIDRRNPDSLIPVQDLRKLLADDKPQPVWTEAQRAAERARLEVLGKLPK